MANNGPGEDNSKARDQGEMAVVINDTSPDGIITPRSDGAPLRRTATWLDAAYHSITGMVGAGVLGLPAAVAPLGWAGGMIVLFTTFWISWYTYILLVNMHEVPDMDSKDPKVSSKRLDRYQDLTAYVLGPRAGKWALLPFQLAVLIGIAITYTVLGAQNLALSASHVAPAETQMLSSMQWAIVFGATQVMLSMLPSFNELSLVSLMGAIMSMGYCGIATVLSAMHKPGPEVSYTPGQGLSHMAYIMAVFNAVTIYYALCIRGPQHRPGDPSYSPLSTIYG